jgi:hypothetical protein
VHVVVSSLVVGCRDPRLVATFWQTTLGGRVVSYPELGVEALRAPGVTFDFVANPDPKTAKNRWHLDLAADDADATIGACLSAGATIAPSFDQTPDFVVMADPRATSSAYSDTPPQTPHGHHQPTGNRKKRGPTNREVQHGAGVQIDGSGCTTSAVRCPGTCA